MFKVLSISLLFAIFQAVTSEIPEHCRGPPPGVVKPAECCKVPRLFTEEDFKECGVDDPTLQRLKAADCTKHMCLLKRYNLVKDGDNVDKEAMGEFFDKWVEKNSDFKDIIDKTKEKCLSDDLPGPPQICEANKIAFCFMVNTYRDCPNWEDNANCNKLKEHMDQCKAFYPF